MLPLSEFCNQEFKHEPYIILPELLPARGKLYIAAPEKHNKSFALLSMGMSLAGGQCVWGVPYFTVPRRFRVGYFDQELGPTRLQKRLRKLRENIPPDELRDNLFFIQPRDRTFRFDTKEGIKSIEDAIKTWQIEVALFDPISKFYPAFDENATQEMSKLILALDTLIANTGVSMVFAHHMPKPSEFPRKGAQRMRGSTVLGADLDTFIEFRRIGPAHAKNQRMEALFITRDEPIEPIYIKRHENGTFSYEGKIEEKAQQTPSHADGDYGFLE